MNSIMDIDTPIRIKQEPVDEEDRTTPPLPRPHEKERKSKKRKRRREEDEEAERPPAIRIKAEKDLFAEEDEEGEVPQQPAPASNDNASTAVDGSAPPPTNTEPPPPTESEPMNGSNSEDAIPGPSTGVHSLTNFFELASAPLPSVEPTFVEKKIDARELGVPEPRPEKVAHYNAHDEEEEKKYHVEYNKTSKKHIDDHRKLVSRKRIDMKLYWMNISCVLISIHY